MRTAASAAQIIFRVSILIGVAIAIATSFFSYKALDANVPFGSKSFLVVTSISDQLTEDEASSVLIGAVSDYRTNLFRVTQTIVGPDTERTLYAFGGDPELLDQLFPDDIYPSFDNEVTTTFESPRDLSRAELLGAYSTTSERSQLAGLIQHLRVSGISVSVEQVSASRALSETLTQSSFAPVIWSTLIGIGLGTVYFVSQRQRVLSVKVLHGHTLIRSGLAELTETAIVFGACCLVAMPVAAIGIAAYNDLHQIGSFGAQTLGILAVLLVAILLTQLIALIFLAEESEIEVIQGKRPSRLVSMATHIAQLGVLFITLLIMTQAAGQVADLKGNQEMSPNWDNAGDYVGIEFEAQGEEEFEAVVSRFGKLVDDLESGGKILLAYHPTQPSSGDPRPGPDRGNSMVVNTTFLDEQPPELIVRGQDYHAVLQSSDILLLVPEQYAHRLDQLEDDYRDWANFQRSQWSSPAISTPLAIQTLITSSDQLVFNYDHASVDIEMGQLDPVIAVIPAASKILPAHFYAAAASQGSLLVDDGQALSNAIETAGLAGQVRPSAAAADLARLAIDRQLRDVAQRGPVVVFLATLLLLTSLLSGAVHCDRHRVENFVHRVHGLSPMKANFAFLLRFSLSSLAVVAVASIIWGTADMISIAIGALCVGLCALGSVLGIVLFENRFRFEVLQLL